MKAKERAQRDVSAVKSEAAHITHIRRNVAKLGMVEKGRWRVKVAARMKAKERGY
jgi:hypothetical protein